MESKVKFKKDQKKKTKKREPVLTLSGISVLMNPKTSALRRSIWGTILSVCFCLLLAQVGERLSHFFSLPVSVSVKVVTNSSLKLPIVTFCPEDWKLKDLFDPAKVYHQYISLSGNYTDVPDYYSALHYLEDRMDVKELWDTLSWNNEDTVKECFLGRGQKCDSVGSFFPVYTFHGVCLSYSGHPISMAGPYHGLYLLLKRYSSLESFKRMNYTHSQFPDLHNVSGSTVPIPDGLLKHYTEGWTVVVHEHNAIPTILVKTHGYLMGENWNKEISVAVKEFLSVNTPTKPCITDSDYSTVNCMTECFEEEYLKIQNCRLPYMTKHSEVPYCKGSKEITAAYKDAKSFLLDGIWKPDECRECISECSRLYYEYRGDTSADRVDNTTRLKVYLVDKTYESVEEEFSYQFTALVADFGGMLGLLLGASVLTMLEAVEFISLAFLRFLQALRDLISRLKPCRWGKKESTKIFVERRKRNERMDVYRIPRRYV